MSADIHFILLLKDSLDIDVREQIFLIIFFHIAAVHRMNPLYQYIISISNKC